MAYEASLKAKWDTQNALDSVKRSIKKETSEQFVKNLLFNTDFSDEKIAALASVSLEFVRNVKTNVQHK